MSDTTPENVESADPGLSGSIEDIEAALGLEPETPEERDALARGDDIPAKSTSTDDDDVKTDIEPATSKKDAKKTAAKPDDEEEEPKKDEKSDEDKAMEEWLAVRKRAAERRRARARGDEAPEPTPAAAAAPAKAEPAKAKEPEVAAAPAAKESEVKSAVADIIKAIARLDDEDGDQPKTDKDVDKLAATAKREVDLDLIKEKLGFLAEKLEASEKLEGKFGEIKAELDARVKEIEDTALVYGHAEATISKFEDKLPHLSRTRNAAQILVREASKFLERTGKAPPMAFVADRVERVLARRAQEKEGAEAPEKNGAAKAASEKQHPSRKTTSSSLATPPSRRQGADTRTPEQVEEDLWKSLGLDPHG